MSTKSMHRLCRPLTIRRALGSWKIKRALSSFTTTPDNAFATPINMHSRMNSATTDWNKCDEFFSFTGARFVTDEQDQLEQRYVRFDMNELARVAARIMGARDCISIDKCPEGMYNKSFVLRMDNEEEVIAKLPNPNAGVPHYTTASEVATMDFVRNVLGTPVPKVYTWNSRADDGVGAEYIIMEKMAGIQLSEIWESMEIKDKMQLRLNLALHQQSWLSLKFRKYGGLYYKQDLPGGPSDDEYLYINQAGERVHNFRFTIGPATGREWSDFGKAALKCDQGPWLTLSDYRKAIGLRELAATMSITPFPKQLVMVCGPRLYQQNTAKKSSAIQSYLHIYDALLPDDPTITASSVWHNDLHEENIFVDCEDPTRITGIIDWQSVDLVPLFDNNLDPAFVQYAGPQPNTLDRPELGDTSGMSNEERKEAIKLYFDKALFIASRKITFSKLPAAYRAIQYQQTHAFDLLTIARRMFEFGEAQFRAATVQLEETWSELPLIKKSALARPFPLTFDDKSLAQIQEDFDRAMRGMQLMDSFKARLGPLWPEKGVVSHHQYHDTKAALRSLKEEMIGGFARSEEEKREFEKLWPFDN